MKRLRAKRPASLRPQRGGSSGGSCSPHARRSQLLARQRRRQGAPFVIPPGFLFWPSCAPTLCLCPRATVRVIYDSGRRARDRARTGVWGIGWARARGGGRKTDAEEGGGSYERLESSLRGSPPLFGASGPRKRADWAHLDEDKQTPARAAAERRPSGQRVDWRGGRRKREGRCCFGLGSKLVSKEAQGCKEGRETVKRDGGAIAAAVGR